jgi:hypothetical protein
LARKVLAEVVSEYDFKQEVNTPVDQLLAIEGQHPVRGIIKLDEMARLIEKVNGTKIIKFCNYKRSHIYISDKELQFIDKLIDHTQLCKFQSRLSFV